MFEAVLFDMDGTLLDSERFWRDAFLDLAHERGWPGAEAFYDRLIGASEVECLERISAWVPEGDPSEITAAWVAGVRRREGGPVPLKPGARELVAQLDARSVPMAVVTSSMRRDAVGLLERAELLPKLRFIIGAEDVPRHKPDPLPYVTAMERIGCAPQATLAFEDSPVGTRSAVASGARVVQVPDLIAPDAEILALGHLVAPDLLSGARAVGLIG
ncbi:MAG: hypothetical protein CSA72_06305 [Rhodobacterales bacterium]|nr:MAG: hypothetical protein CSA72_06305 [Rhodobacterales bacterium]